jgi:hypothetical protein
MLAVLAVSAVGSTSASAACPKEKEKDLSYCVSGAEVTAPFAEAFEAAGVGNYELKGAITIICGMIGSGELTQEKDPGEPKNANVTLTFVECSIEGRPKCDVQDSVTKTPGTIEVKGITSGVKEIGGVLYDVFKSATGTFVTLEVVNHKAQACPKNVKGSYPITGETAAELEPLGVDAVKPEVDSSAAIDKAAGVGLKLKGVAASFEGAATLELTGTNEGNVFGVNES